MLVFYVVLAAITSIQLCYYVDDNDVHLIGFAILKCADAASSDTEKAWLCDWPGCELLFRYRSRLAEHRRSHTHEKPYACTWPGCEKRFANRGNLNRHTATHTTRASLVCEHDGCQKLFKTKATLKAHMALHREANKFVCSWEGCGREFATAARRASHETTHKMSGDYMCNYWGCGYRCDSEAKLSVHKLKHVVRDKEGQGSGKKIGKRLVSSGDTFKINTRPRLGECDSLGGGTDHSTTTEEYMSAEGKRAADCTAIGHNARARVTNNAVCSTTEKLSDRGGLGMAEKASSEDTSVLEDKRATDVKDTTASDAPTFKMRWLDLYACDWPGCDAAFDKKHQLKAHAATHINKSSTERPYKCHWPGCRLAFAKQATLAKHLNKHVVYREFRCDHPGCGATFTDAGGLIKHKRTHTGEKPFVCTWEGCGKGFAQSQNLTAHLRQHSGEMPFVCLYPGCDRRFKSVQALKYHKSTHTPKEIWD
ncbi:hypothetical protein SARC_09600 [Sphaeroforma arctica JP610]|uniref:C2H2-type domain-containing protein n=1 Tax=Sphaeroforma arctica JP610 TaxID=667725 RepID=A0A0L0FMG5_9EUKA|nr:hypothetical protein SARC_09600 [Sphaeroforma arctica JP610]KNC77950.1 hypothetical protein SARC_09600 [Sphaeroforma arctica JP610]|eukprot:XP_014151852.1 hypothetical protein SARC_09600 [Sphaeroforma arctica JP610]